MPQGARSCVLFPKQKTWDPLEAVSSSTQRDALSQCRQVCRQLPSPLPPPPGSWVCSRLFFCPPDHLHLALNPARAAQKSVFPSRDNSPFFLLRPPLGPEESSSPDRKPATKPSLAVLRTLQPSPLGTGCLLPLAFVPLCLQSP